MLFHDRDSKFTAAVDADLARAGIEVVETAFRAPNTNAFVERFIRNRSRNDIFPALLA